MTDPNAVILVPCRGIRGAITMTHRAARWLDTVRDCEVWRRPASGARFIGAPA